MKTIARISGVILIAAGIIVMVLTVIAGVGRALRLLGTSVIPRLGGTARLGAGTGLILGAAIFLQGLMLSAFGEVTYLVAEIAERLKDNAAGN